MQVNKVKYKLPCALNTDTYIHIPLIHTLHHGMPKHTSTQSVSTSTQKYSQVPTNTSQYVDCTIRSIT